MKKLVCIISIIVVVIGLAACSDDIRYSAKQVKNNGEHAKITAEFKEMLKKDPALKELMEESIELAAINNPDTKTNPVRSLEDYYAFLDWSATCMPWNILDDYNPSLYMSIDQSLDYFYYLLDQPLPELAGKGYYYPCLEYHEPVASWVEKYCKDWGAFLDTEESWNDKIYKSIVADKEFNMDKGWYSDKNEWKTMNEWFARNLVSPKVRPISDTDVVSPADSTPQGVWKIDKNSQIDLGVQLKSVRFNNIEDLIGKDSKYEKEFAGGTLTHTFLDVNDYHRYHFPLSGKVLEVRKIEALDGVGGIVSWDKKQKKYVLWDNNPGWQSIETRDCLILDTEYGLVAILPIGMSQVSSCNWEDNVKSGLKVKAGDPMGYFQFGGSDIVMIFQDGVKLRHVAKKHLLMGEPYADIDER